MNEEEQKQCLIIIFIAEMNINKAKNRMEMLIDLFPNQINSGLLELTSPHEDFYPKFALKHKNVNESETRIKWRSKQSLDFAFLMLYSQNRGRYYLHLEDDIITKSGFVTSILDFIKSKNEKDWFMLSFCKLTSIGKVFKTKDLSSLSHFIFNFYDIFPVDWLLYHYINVRFCPPHQVNKYECQRKLHSDFVFSRKRSLFQHVGIYSSLKGKVQKLKDDTF